MGANQDFITDNILSHVWNHDPAELAAAFAGCTEQDCDVRTYGPATSPNWARFFSPTERSPQGGFGNWWAFEYIGDNLSPDAPEPVAGTSPPFWGFSENSDAASDEAAPDIGTDDGKADLG